jgi:hypothetical protein
VQKQSDSHSVPQLQSTVFPVSHCICNCVNLACSIEVLFEFVKGEIDAIKQKQF